MTENASHVVVHHHFDNGSGTNLLSMTCCIVLSVVIVLILLIIFVIIIYMISQRSKHNHQKSPPADLPQTFPNLPRTIPAVTRRATSTAHNTNVRRGIYNPAASFEEQEIDINSNRQSIPMTTFKPNIEGMQADSSESSAGLCEVLFSERHEGEEVIYDPPPKAVAFAGRVYATSGRHRGPVLPFEPGPSGPVLPFEPGPSGSGIAHRNSENSSMEWDYHESRRYGTSNDSETDRRDTVDVCWV